MKTSVKGVKDVQKVNELNVIEVQTRLDKETAQTAVTKEQKRLLKIEVVQEMIEDFENSIEPLKSILYNEKEQKTKFEKDFAKGENEYKGVFALFNTLAKGKSSNDLNKSFYTNKLDKKFKFGKEYNGLLLLACMKSSDLIGQINNPQKFTTSNFRQAFKAFNTYITSFKTFEEALERSKVINNLIAKYKGVKDKEGKIIEQIDLHTFVMELNNLKFYENLKDGLTMGLSEQAKKKVCSKAYSL